VVLLTVQHCKKQDIEICALKLTLGTMNICVLTLYRAPSGNNNSFLLKLDTILQSLYTPMLHFIICGDININYLNESENKNLLDNLFLSYNLTSIIYSPDESTKYEVRLISNAHSEISRKRDHVFKQTKVGSKVQYFSYKLTYLFFDIVALSFNTFFPA